MRVIFKGVAIFYMDTNNCVKTIIIIIYILSSNVFKHFYDSRLFSIKYKSIHKKLAKNIGENM